MAKKSKKTEDENIKVVAKCDNPNEVYPFNFADFIKDACDSWYKIPTPIGNYEPDFGVVLKRVSLRNNQDQQEYYFVVEIKGTNDPLDKKALTPHEIARMEFAKKHFRSLGIEAYYKAPIREYTKFGEETNKTIKQ